MKGQWESEPRGFCKIDAEALTAALIAPGHGRTGVAELALHVAFFDFGRRSHSGAQRMPGKIVLPVGFGKIAEATDALAHRLILQESLVHRLCEAVMAALSPLGAGVVITAEHGCMQVRGPKRRQSRVTVEAWAGVFEKDGELRASLARRAGG